MTSSAAPLEQLAKRIEQHLRERELNRDPQPKKPRPRLTLPLVLFIVGPAVGALGLFYAAIAWHGDPLVTYKGWVVVSCTTFCALAVFVGESRWRHAQDARKAVTKDEVVQLLAEAEIERLRHEQVIKEMIEETLLLLRHLQKRFDDVGQRSALDHKQLREALAVFVSPNVYDLETMRGLAALDNRLHGDNPRGTE